MMHHMSPCVCVGIGPGGVPLSVYTLVSSTHARQHYTLSSGHINHLSNYCAGSPQQGIHVCVIT